MVKCCVLFEVRAEQNPVEAHNRSATNEIPCLLWNQNFYYSVSKCPPLVPILSQITPFLLVYLRLILILSSHLCLILSKWYLTFRFSDQTLYAFMISTCVLHSGTSHNPWFERSPFHCSSFNINKDIPSLCNSSVHTHTYRHAYIL
jgi:hypothetical protein